MFATDGRRPVYLTVLPIFAIGSLGVALARNVPQLLLFRVVQAFGGGGGMSIGAGVISDIYRLEQRGTAMGVFFAVSVLLARAGFDVAHVLTSNKIPFIPF